jgi:hypothetical protein
MSGGADNLFDSFRAKARQVGVAATLFSQKTKLRAEILFLERSVKTRQQSFGVQLYDYVSIWSAQPDFFSANEDNILIATLRPPLIQAQREIAALQLRHTMLTEQMHDKSASKTAAYNQKSDDWKEKIHNAGRTTMFAGAEAKLKAELALLERDMNQHKHTFGVTLYQQFALLEDTKQWLPTDREIRAFYDGCRRDIDSIKNRIAEKEQEIRTLDERATANSNSLYNGEQRQQQQQPAYLYNTSSYEESGTNASVPPPFITVAGMQQQNQHADPEDKFL